MLDGYSTADGLITIGFQPWTDYEVKTSTLMLPTFPDTTAALPESGIIFRYTDPQNFYFAGIGLLGRFAAISKLVNGAYTELAFVGVQSDVAFNQKYELKVKAVGNKIELYVNGTLTLSYTDAANSHPSGGIGLGLYSSHAQFDYISAVSLTSPIPWLPIGLSLLGVGVVYYATR